MTGSADFRVVDLTAFEPMPPLEAQPEVALQWINIADLRFDPGYQRTIERRGRLNIQRIAEDFSWQRFTPLLVAPEGAAYWVIDGQHRAHAAALRGAPAVPAMVVSMSRIEQAKAFSWVNGNVTNVTPFQIFKAALIAGEDWATQCRDVVQRADCRLMTSNRSADHKMPGEIYCIDLIRGHVERNNAKYVELGLRAIVESQDAKEPTMYSATILRPWLQVIIDLNLLDKRLLAEFLAAHSFTTILRKVDVLRETPEYFRKSRSTLVQASLAALVKNFARHRAGLL